MNSDLFGGDGLLGRVGAVENQFGYLATLYAGAVGTLRRALELESDFADVHLAETFLSEVTQLGPVQNRRRCIVRVRLHLPIKHKLFNKKK